MLGMATRDALHSKTVITNQHDIHVRGLIVRLSVGCFCKHRKLDIKIDLIVGRAIERNRALGTYPSEEITGNAPPLRKGEYFLEAVFGLVFGGDIFDCNLAHNRINFEICCKITTRECHPVAPS